MISKQKRTSLLSAVLAIPPVLLIAALVSKIMPAVEPVSSVIAANDPEISSLHQKDARYVRPYYALDAH